MSGPVAFSTVLRERSCAARAGGDEGAAFVSRMLRGEGSRQDYIDLVAQHWFVYDALETAAARMRRDPVASVFISDRLTRLPALEADLAFLVGDDWRARIAPLPSTRRYVERIRLVGTLWAGGFVAHHYTRYLGDLSGAEFLASLLQRRFGFETNGIGFFVFGDIADPRAFKDVYRAELDAAPWDDAERRRVGDEVLRAYRLTTALFDDLARSRRVA